MMVRSAITASFLASSGIVHSCDPNVVLGEADDQGRRIEVPIQPVDQAEAPADQLDGPINLTRQGFKRSTLETPVGEVVVFEAGEGEPLLLLHGIGAGASSYIWFALAPKLAEDYRVIAPDFVGWGDSERLDRTILFDDYVTQIRAIGDWIGEPTRLITQSLTCGFVIAAMRDDGLAVKRLVLHGPAGGLDFGVDAVGAQVSENFKRILESPQREQIYAGIFHQRPAIESWFRGAGFLDPNAVPEETIVASLYNARRPNSAFAALPFLSGELRYDIAPLLKELSVPTLMVWGDNEIQISPTVRERIEKVNPEIKVARIENARSSFEIEQVDATLKRLLPFLRGDE